MPELPEVETIRRDLAPRVVGRTITRVRIRPGTERLAITHAPRALERVLSGRRIEDLGRHGKYLIARLDAGRHWVTHLRMSGSLLHVPRAVRAGRFERARVDLDDGCSLRLNDMRKFATWHVVDDPREAMPNCGPDALDDACSVAWLRAACARRSAPVKAALLDQGVAAGVGNIYADEACWLARIDPRRPACELTARQVGRLHAGLREALHAALEHRGSTFSNYFDGLGAEGMHQVYWHVYRREGEPCHRCGRPIAKLRVASRGTHLCTHCQR